VPRAALAWTSRDPAALRRYHCTPGHARGFCGACGTRLFWEREAGPNVSLAVGTVDPLYLFGEGAGGDGAARDVPPGGFGRALANACGGHEWVQNEVPGVTDRDLALVGLAGRGERVVSESE
jgi:hypothetical protein